MGVERNGIHGVWEEWSKSIGDRNVASSSAKVQLTPVSVKIDLSTRQHSFFSTFSLRRADQKVGHRPILLL